MQKQVFRQYDIRGKIDTEINVIDFYNLTRATIYYLQKQGPCSAIAIGMDGRVHSSAIIDQVIAACIDAGVTAHVIGLCSTPVVLFSQYNLPVQAGFMITASHNPKEYNGMKIHYNKTAIIGDKLQQIYEISLSEKFEKSFVAGKKNDATGVVDLYIDSLATSFSHLKKMNEPCFIDCGNGAAGPFVEKIKMKMGWDKAEIMFGDVDGTYPNHTADPTQMKNVTQLYEKVRNNPGSFGIAFDGDGDRVAVVSGTVGLLKGDQLLALFARYASSEIVIGDIKSSSVLKNCGSKVFLAATGCASVKTKMQETGALLGGEVSGHFFFKDRHPGYDDGLYGMMRFFEILLEENIDCDTLIAKLPESFATKDIRIPCSDEEKYRIVADVTKQLQKESVWNLVTTDGVRFENEKSWGLIRAANTQPMISACCDAETKQELEVIKDLLKTILKPYIRSKIVDQYFDNE